jgi:hypothetical protein
VVFKRLNALADGGLCDKQSLRGSGEGFFLSYG